MLAAAVLLSSCLSTTMIRSVPDGARVYINGEPVGITPCEYGDTRIVGCTNKVMLEKEGYETLYTSFSRDEEVDVGAIIAGFFVWVPFLWTMKYKPFHIYELKPANGEAPDGKSVTERLRELKRMHDEKLITDSEYEAAKKKLLETP